METRIWGNDIMNFHMFSTCVEVYPCKCNGLRFPTFVGGDSEEKDGGCRGVLLHLDILLFNALDNNKNIK